MGLHALARAGIGARAREQGLAGADRLDGKAAGREIPAQAQDSSSYLLLAQFDKAKASIAWLGDDEHDDGSTL